MLTRAFRCLPRPRLAGACNAASLCAARELGGGARSLRRCGRHVGSSRLVGARLARWVEQDSLRNCAAVYCPLNPPPRSTIAACFRPDGAELASTHGDHTVKLVDATTGACVRTLEGHRRTPWVVRYHPHEPRLLASGSLDHDVRIWDAASGECLHAHDFERPIASLAFHAAGEVMAVATGHKLFMWPCRPGKDGRGVQVGTPRPVLRTKRSLRAVHFHPLGAPLLLTAEVNTANPEQDPPATARWSTWSDSWHQSGGPEGSAAAVQAAHAAAVTAATAAADAARLARAAALGGAPPPPAPQQRIAPPNVPQQAQQAAAMPPGITAMDVDRDGAGGAGAGDGAGGAGADVGAGAPLDGVYESMSAAAIAAERYANIDPTLQQHDRQALIAAAAAAAEAAHRERERQGAAEAMEQDSGDALSLRAGVRGATGARSEDGRSWLQEQRRDPPSSAHSMWETPPDLQLLQTVGGEPSAAAAAAAAAASTAAAAVAAAASAHETPCTGLLRLWGLDEADTSRSLQAAQPRLAIPHAVLCSEMCAHLSPCGAYMAACVACRAPGPPEGASEGDAAPQAGVVYELRIYSLRERDFGAVLAARPVRAAHCLTSIQFSPTSQHVMLAYGRRHISLLRSLVAHGGSIMPVHTILEVYRVSDMSLVRMLPSAEDEVNVAVFHPHSGGGLVYGTKEGRLRILHHGRPVAGQNSGGVANSALEDTLIASSGAA